MDAVINTFPPEIVDIIAYKLHRMYMKDLIVEINYTVVWIQLKNGKRSFLTGKSNYYSVLDECLHKYGMIVIRQRRRRF